MEEHIDIDHIRKIEQLQYDAINYKKIERLPLTISTKAEGFHRLPMQEAFGDPEMMLYNEILQSTVHSSYNSVRTKDDGPLMIRANHGIGIIASMFGCKSYCSDERMPWVAPISLDEAKKVFAKGVPDVKSALGKRVIETYQYYHERLKSFPKCYDAIRITQPDMQGPFNIIHLVLGEQAFLLPYDDPDFLSYMTDVVAKTYVLFRKELDPILTDRFYDAVFVHGFCCGGKLLLKADTPTANLSKELFALYEKEPEEFILDIFKKQGGGSVHYCGGPLPWHNEMIYSEHLRCVNYGSPEMQDLASNYAYMKEKSVAIVGWGQNLPYDEVKSAFECADDGKPALTGLTLICEADSARQGRDILKKHRQICAEQRSWA